MAHDYLNAEKVVVVSNAVAAGTNDVNFIGVDTEGFDSIECIAVFGALTANQVTALHAQQSDDNGSTDTWNDIAGSSTTAMADDDDNQALRCEVAKPGKRYVRFVADRATANAVIEAAVCVLRGADREPVTQDGSVAFTKRVVAAAEGTA